MRMIYKSFLFFGIASALPFAAAAQTDAELTVTADIATGQEGDLPLYLEVYVNGKATNLVAEFALDLGDGSISSPRSELEQVGLELPAGQRGMVALRDIPGVRYSYDEAAQTINIIAPLSAMQTEVVSAIPETELLTPERSYGAVLNYNLDAGHDQVGASGYTSFSASLDGWIFAPIGTLRSTGVVRDSLGDETAREGLRLETTYQVSSPKKRLSFALGDVQSSALSWSRSIRMGGVQLRRDFGLRADLVTQQLLSFEGAAAVPSTVDLFIDNNRTYSTGRDPGPFRLEDLPVQAGPGQALIVVTDANGRKTTKAVSFYVSQKLLKKGLVDFSIEAGRAREAYGIESAAYGSDAVLSASLRFGLSERITLEGHVEQKSDLSLVGLGLTTVPFNLAELSLAAGASDYNDRQAAFAYGALQTRIGSVDLSGQMRWSEEGFADLAYATGVDFLGADVIEQSASLLETPRLQTAINLSVPLQYGSNFGLGYVASRRSHSEDQLITASFGRDLAGANGSVSFYGAHDLESGESRVAMGLSMTLGKRKSVRVTSSADAAGNVTGGVHLSRAISDRQGDYGYAAELARKESGGINFTGRGEYLGRYGKAGVDLRLADGATAARVQLDGAVAMAGGAVAFGAHISDSFAIVDVGAAGVPVSVHNRKTTRTGHSGKALVTGLQSNRRNRVSVEVDDLPEGVTLDASGMDVVPAIGSGVRVKFRGETENSAVIILKTASGQEMEAGTVAYLNGGKEEFFVGFGGETFVQGLGSKNRLKVKTERGTCVAEFAFTPQSGPMQVIEGIACR